MIYKITRDNTSLGKCFKIAFRNKAVFQLQKTFGLTFSKFKKKNHIPPPKTRRDIKLTIIKMLKKKKKKVSLTCQATIIAHSFFWVAMWNSAFLGSPRSDLLMSVPTRGSGPMPVQRLTTPKQINQGPFNQTHCSGPDGGSTSTGGIFAPLIPK